MGATDSDVFVAYALATSTTTVINEKPISAVIMFVTMMFFMEAVTLTFDFVFCDAQELVFLQMF